MEVGRSFLVHPFRRGAVAALLLLGLAGVTQPAAAARATSPQAVEAGGAAGWGPFRFGMSPAAAQRAARANGGRLATAGRTALAYRDGRGADYALLEFTAGRLARVTVPLLREAAPDPTACQALHDVAAARLQAEAGPAALLASAATGDGETRAWSAALRQPDPRAARVAVETVWEAPEETMDAGSDDTCISVAIHLPPGHRVPD